MASHGGRFSMSAGAGIGAGLVSESRAGAGATATPARRAAEIWSQEYWAQQGRREAQPLAQARRRAEARREAAADPVPGARLVELDAHVRPLDRAGRRHFLMNVMAREGDHVRTMDHDG